MVTRILMKAVQASKTLLLKFRFPFDNPGSATFLFAFYRLYKLRFGFDKITLEPPPRSHKVDRCSQYAACLCLGPKLGHFRPRHKIRFTH